MAKFSKSDRMSTIVSKPNVRKDGEMYERPKPNPFTPEWREGYNDAYDGHARQGIGPDYNDGYDTGLEQLEADKEEMDRVGSSNA